jgi:hypothetical protein
MYGKQKTVQRFDNIQIFLSGEGCKAPQTLTTTEDLCMLQHSYCTLGQRLLCFDDLIFTISFHFHLLLHPILTLCNKDNIVLSVVSV